MKANMLVWYSGSAFGVANGLSLLAVELETTVFNMEMLMFVSQTKYIWSRIWGTRRLEGWKLSGWLAYLQVTGGCGFSSVVSVSHVD